MELGCEDQEKEVIIVNHSFADRRYGLPLMNSYMEDVRLNGNVMKLNYEILWVMIYKAANWIQ